MIKSINLNNIKEVTELFIECFNNPPWNDKWDYLTASRRLTDIANTPGYFGMSYYQEEKLVGIIMGRSEQYYDEDFQKELNRIIEEDQDLILNKNKTRLQGHFYRQEVTGLVVNEKVNLRRRYIKQIRMWIYYWEKYGFEKAEEIFKRDYLADKGYVKKGIPNFINVLDGKLEYCKMVKGVNDNTYQKLKMRFDKLNKQPNDVERILDIWDKEGIEKAIEIYGNIIL